MGEAQCGKIKPMSEVCIGAPTDGLWLRVKDRDFDGSVVTIEATMRSPGLEARRLVGHHYARGFEELVDFFADLERGWKGWDGSKTFVSLEGDLALTAIHNGHVWLTIRLRHPTLEEGWDVTTLVRLDPGEQVSRTTAEVRDLLIARP